MSEAHDSRTTGSILVVEREGNGHTIVARTNSTKDDKPERQLRLVRRMVRRPVPIPATFASLCSAASRALGWLAPANRSFREMTIAIAAFVLGALIATPTKKVIDFRFKCVLEHLAGSLADQLFQHIIWRGDGCGRRQNLIPCRHGVTLLQCGSGDRTGW